MRPQLLALLLLPLLLLLLCASAFAWECDDARPLLSDEFLSSLRPLTWQAGPTRWQGVPLCEARRALMQDEGLLERLSLRRPRSGASSSPSLSSSLPASFSAKDKWPACIGPILDQGACGSCWAFSAAEVLSDNFCITSNGTQNVSLSPQYLVSCDYTNLGCNGGLPPSVWWWMKHKGLVSMDCFPYSSGKNGTTPPCLEDKQCTSSSVPFQLYYASSYEHLFDLLSVEKTCERIMDHLVNFGGAQAGFLVYEDFMSYKSGVYQHTGGALVGAHAVKVIGYGEENGVPYWLVANSWGTDWGLDGFFKIKRGVEECGFEVEVYGGMAKLS